MKLYKKSLWALMVLFFMGTSAIGFAQQAKYCVIDSKYIIEKLPEYERAEKQIEQFSEKWEAEVENAMNAIEKMYRSYQTERPMLSENARQKREEEIITKEREAKELQKQYFGYEGKLFQKRQELIQPIQDKVFNAVQQYAKSNNYEIIYDKSGGITIFYSEAHLDKSEEIIKLIQK